MNVFTYYEPLGDGGDWAETVELWKKSWSAQGWSPIVLDRSHAVLHPLFNPYLAVVSAFPTVNGRAYEVSSFLRHLAFAAVEGLCTDFDVMNRSFTPDQCAKAIEGKEIVSFFQPNASPCTHWATRQMRETIVRIFLYWEPTLWELIGGRPHISDKSIFSHFKIPCHHWTKLQTDPESPSAPLVHFNRLSLDYDKPKAIRNSGIIT